ncbi:MAG: glycosyltransferase family 4 protein [Clostridia bacterium]|nr:glycosyltransferase family 4 protein [Clostridia bacterium]MDQ7790970.1 glycosyltransferase family 4 protein [Clostridia bacterium]
MRIMHLAEALVFGGLETQLLSLCQDFKRMGHHPYVFARLMSSEFLAQFKELGIEYMVDGTPGERLPEYIREQDIQVLHGHPVVIPLAAALGEQLHIPVVATYHGFFGWNLKTHGSIHKLICISQEVYDKVAMADPGVVNKLMVIQNGIDIERFKPFHKPVNGNKVLFIGRMDQDKRYSLKIIFETIKALPGIELLVAGSGPYLDQLRAEAPPGVRWLGYVSDMPAAINQADVAIGTGRGVREAMACGVPAIALDACGYDGLVTPETVKFLEYQNFMGRSGRPLNPENVLEDMKKILYDPEYRVTIGQWSRKYAKDNYDATSAALKHLLVYNELINPIR